MSFDDDDLKRWYEIMIYQQVEEEIITNLTTKNLPKPESIPYPQWKIEEMVKKRIEEKKKEEMERLENFPYPKQGEENAE